MHLTWFDSGGGSNSKTLPVTVRNVAPQVCAGPPAVLEAGAMLLRTVDGGRRWTALSL